VFKVCDYINVQPPDVCAAYELAQLDASVEYLRVTFGGPR
jgi:hypothetical protein